MMAASLAESAVEQGRRVLIVTSQNSADNSAIEKLKYWKYMIVRAHLLGLEGRAMRQSRQKPEDLKTEDAGNETIKAHESPDTVSLTDIGNSEVARVDYVRMCEEHFLAKEPVLRPGDPRCRKLNLQFIHGFSNLQVAFQALGASNPPRNRFKWVLTMSRVYFVNCTSRQRLRDLAPCR